MQGHTGSSGSTFGVLAPPTTDQLQAINRDFLDLLVAEHNSASTHPRSESLYLPARVAAELSSLSPSELDAIAKCKYTLFSLSFHATDAWHQLARSTTSSDCIESRYAWMVSESRSQTATAGLFAVALAFSWHLAQVNKHLARVVLALRDDTAAAFNTIPLWRLHQIAHKHPQLFMPRWPNNPCFWQDLIRLAHDGTPAQLESAQLRGTQLIAKELEPSSIERLATQTRAPRRK